MAPDKFGQQDIELWRKSQHNIFINFSKYKTIKFMDVAKLTTQPYLDNIWEYCTIREVFEAVFFLRQSEIDQLQIQHCQLLFL